MSRRRDTLTSFFGRGADTFCTVCVGLKKLFSRRFYVFALFTFLMLAVLLPNIRFRVEAAGTTKYAVNAGGNWNTAATWSTVATKDATRVANTTVPAAGDIVIIDSYSGNVVVNAATASIASLDMTGYTGTLSGTYNITVGYNGSGSTNVKFAGTVSWTGGLYLNPIASGDTINLNCNSKTISKIYVGNTASSSGKVYFLDAVSVTSWVVLTTGELHTDGASDNSAISHTIKEFDSTGTGTRTLNLGHSTITMSQNASVGTVWNCTTSTNMTLLAASSTITLTGAGTTSTVLAAFGSTTLTYGTINITGSGASVITGTGTITFTNLNRTGTAAKTDYLYLSNNFTVSGSFNFSGNSSVNRLLVASSKIETPRTLTVSGATYSSSSNVDFRDISFVSTGNVDLSSITGGSGNCGGNTISGGGTLTFTTGTTWYWNGSGSRNFSDYTYWYSATNGGGSQMTSTRVPLAQDSMIINGDSIDGSTTVTQDLVRIGGVDCSGSAAFTWNWNALGLYVHGSLVLTASSSATTTSSILYLSGRGNYTFTPSGNSMNQFWIYAPNGTYTLGSALTCASYIVTSAGTLTTNGYSVTATTVSYDSATPTVAPVVNLGSSNITLTGTGTLWDQPGRTVNAGTSTIYLSYTGSTATSFSGRSAIFNDISIAPGSNTLTFLTAMTFHNMTMSTTGSKTIIFTNGITYTMTGTSFISGSSSGYVSLIPTGSGNQPVINNTSGGKVVSDYIQVAGINVTPSNTWFPGAHSYANKGLWFDSSSGYVVAPNNATVNQFSGSTAYTVEAWTIATGAGESNNGRIFDKRSAAATGVQVQINATPNINVYADCSSSQNAYASSATISWYRMHHIVGVWTGSQIITYVDGVAGSSVATSGTPVNDSSLAMYIGNRLNDDRTFKGMIVSLRVYRNKGLSQSDVTAAFSAGPKAAQPVSGATSEYLFNEGSGSTLTDDISGVNGTIYTAVWSNTGWEIDTTAPEAPNAATATIGGDEITAGQWTGSADYPSFNFSGASDSGIGLGGYYTYWGTSSDGDPNNYQEHIGNAEAPQSFAPSGTSEDGHYYFRVKAVDIYGNASTTATLFDLKYDHTVPIRPNYITSNPAGYSQTNNFSFSWPAGSDPGGNSEESSGIKWYEYKRATDMAWSHTSSSSDRSVSDLTAYQEGANTFYVRTVDNVDNPSSTYAQVTYYWSGEAPLKPSSLAVTPNSSSSNSFTICWDKPSQDLGESPIVGYRYSINEPPTATNTTYIASTAAHVCVGPDSYATRQGGNVVYVISQNEAGHNSYLPAYYATATFSCNTPAPPAPTSVSLFDSSDKVFSRWMLTIQWTPGANQDSDVFDHYSVERSTDAITYSELAQTTSNTSYIDSNNLSNQTTYYYRIRSVDNAGKTSAYSSVVSAKPSGKYTSPPSIISAPVVSEISATLAKVSWSTDRSSLSYVRYGKADGDFTDSTGAVSAVTNHELTVPGLSGSTTYYFQVQSLDNARDYSPDSAYSDSYSFTTEASPAISNVAVDNITLDSADISWETTTISSSKVKYGEGTSYDKEVEDVSGTQTTKHSGKITSLKDDSVYHFKISATDVVGNELISDDYSFQTLPLPRIESFKIESLPDRPTQTIKVTWDTNVETSSTVKYSAIGVTSEEKSKARLEKGHEIEIENLADNSIYNITITGRDRFGNLAQGDTKSYETPFDTREAKISDIVIETNNVGMGKTEKAQIAVSWKTDEPTSSQVEYGQGIEGDFTQKTIVDSTLTSSHLVIISELAPQTPYHLRVISTDKGGNISQSETQTIVSGDVQKSVFTLILNMLENTFGWMMRGQ